MSSKISACLKFRHTCKIRARERDHPLCTATDFVCDSWSTAVVASNSSPWLESFTCFLSIRCAFLNEGRQIATMATAGSMVVQTAGSTKLSEGQEHQLCNLLREWWDLQVVSGLVGSSRSHTTCRIMSKTKVLIVSVSWDYIFRHAYRINPQETQDEHHANGSLHGRFGAPTVVDMAGVSVVHLVNRTDDDKKVCEDVGYLHAVVERFDFQASARLL